MPRCPRLFLHCRRIELRTVEGPGDSVFAGSIGPCRAHRAYGVYAACRCSRVLRTGVQCGVPRDSSSSSSFADSTLKGNDLAVEAPLPRDLEEVLEEIRQESSG